MEYKRLPGTGRTGFIHAEQVRLYLGPDHLLQVLSADYREDYRRFYYRDIQAIVARRTDFRVAWNYILGVTVVLFAFAGIVSGSFWPRFLALSASAFSGCLVAINSLLGPSIEVYLRTAVGSERLFALRRERTLRVFLDRIRPWIEAAQAELTVEGEADDAGDDSQVAGEVFSMVPSRGGTLTAASPTKPPRIVRHCAGHAHYFLFSLLLMNAVRSVLALHLENEVMASLRWLIPVPLTGFIIWSLISQRDSDMDRPVKRCVMAALGYLVVFGMMGSVINMFGVFEAATRGHAAKPFDPYRLPSSSPPPWFSLSNAVVSVAIGAIGLYRLSQRRRRRSNPVPPPLPVGSAATEEGSV